MTTRVYLAALLNPTAVKTTAYTAAVNDRVLVDTSSSAFTITLPSAPSDKSRIDVQLVAGTNALTVARAGTDVFDKTGGATSLTLSNIGQMVALQYDAAAGLWHVTYTGVTSGSSAPTRTAMLHLGGSGGQTATTFGQLLLRVPIRVAQTTTRWRVRIGQEDLFANTNGPGSVPLDGVWFGEAALDSLGALTGAFKTTPTQILTAQSTPSDGSALVGSWITTTGLQLVAGRTYLLSYSANFTSMTSVTRASGWTWYKTGGTSTEAAATTVTSLATLDATVLDFEIEYDAPTNAPVVMFFGDSLTDGWRCGRGVHSAWGSIYGQTTGTVSIINAYAGAYTSQFTTVGHKKYTRYSGLVLDAAVVMLGTNDILNSVSAATIEANLATVYSNIRSVWGADLPIYAVLIPPLGQASGSGFDNVRVAVNTWLRGMPHNLAGLIDADRKVRSASAINSTDADYDYGDGIHYKVAGQAAIASVVPAPLRRK